MKFLNKFPIFPHYHIQNISKNYLLIINIDKLYIYSTFNNVSIKYDYSGRFIKKYEYEYSKNNIIKTCKIYDKQNKLINKLKYSFEKNKLIIKETKEQKRNYQIEFDNDNIILFEKYNEQMNLIKSLKFNYEEKYLNSIHMGKDRYFDYDCLNDGFETTKILSNNDKTINLIIKNDLFQSFQIKSNNIIGEVENIKFEYNVNNLIKRIYKEKNNDIIFDNKYYYNENNELNSVETKYLKIEFNIV
jgi:hypothetical protein